MGIIIQIPVPPRSCNHFARFNGWNLDERFKQPTREWNGTSYIHSNPTESARAERAIVVLVGDASQADTLSVQYAQNNGVVVGTYITLAFPVIALLLSLLSLLANWSYHR